MHERDDQPMSANNGPGDSDRKDGCWHYGYERFCVQCDPASYGPCDQPCPYAHNCCTCGNADGYACDLLGHAEDGERRL